MNDSLTKYHKVLANFFLSKPLYIDESKSQMNIRKIVELPFQQLKSKSFNSLKETLVDMDFFLSIFDYDRYELWRYWHEMPPNLENLVDIYSEAMKIWQSKSGKSIRYERALNELANVYYLNGKKNESKELYEEVMKLATELYPADDIRLAIRKHNLAATLIVEETQAPQAEKLLTEVLEVFIKYYGENHSETWNCRASIAVCHSYMDEIEESIYELEQCVNWGRIHYGNNNATTLNMVKNLANNLFRVGRFKESLQLDLEVIEGISKLFSMDYPDLIPTLMQARKNIRMIDEQGVKFVEGNLDEKLLQKIITLFGNYEQNKNFLQALKEFHNLETLANGFDDKKVMFISKFGQFRNLIFLERYDEADEIAIQTLVLAFHFYNYLGEMYERDGLLQNVLRVYKEHKEFNEGVLNLFPRESTFKEKENLYKKELLNEINYLKLQNAVNINNKALEFRKQGQFDKAKILLQEALQIDEDIRGKGDPKIAHRLNNLCTILIIQGNYGEAKQHLIRAWEIKQRTGHDITTPRLLFVRLTIGILQSEKIDLFIGQLKSVLSISKLKDYADVSETFDIMYFVEFLRPELLGNFDFLSSLSTAINDNSKLSSLDQFDLWKNQNEVSLDYVWT